MKVTILLLYILQIKLPLLRYWELTGNLFIPCQYGLKVSSGYVDATFYGTYG